MIRISALLLILTATLVRADDPTSAGIAEFNAAWQAWDGARFWNAAEHFRQAAAQDPGSAVNFYWLGTARFHRMLQLRGAKADARAADGERDRAMEAFEAAVKLNNRDAESHALLGTLCGMKINGSVLRGIRYGPSVEEHQALALKFGDDNPRVRYLLGTGLFHTAKNDADRRVALKTFLEAERLFAVEEKRPAKPFEPRWGKSTCLTFIGRTYEMLGHKEEAADYFRKALAVHPVDQVAKDGLSRLSTAN